MAEVDGLNAGYARALLDEYLENPEGVPPEWRALFETNLFSAFELSRFAFPLLSQHAASSIVNIGSVSGLTHVRTGAVGRLVDR